MMDAKMLRSRQEWYDYCIERGTSGDMVFDILKDWKNGELALASRVAELEKENAALDAEAMMWVGKKQELEDQLAAKELQVAELELAGAMVDGAILAIEDDWHGTTPVAKLEKHWPAMKRLGDARVQLRAALRQAAAKER
jgi:hypothetical protein